MDYVFPEAIVKVLKKPSQRTIMEASLLALTIMILSLLVFTVYVVFFTSSSLFIKILTGVNGLAGMVLLGGYLSTSYLQYYTFKLMMNMYPKDEFVCPASEVADLPDQNLNVEGGKNGFK